MRGEYNGCIFCKPRLVAMWDAIQSSKVLNLMHNKLLVGWNTWLYANFSPWLDKSNTMQALIWSGLPWTSSGSQIPCFRPETPGFYPWCWLTKQEGHGRKLGCLRWQTGTRDSKIQDGEDIDLLRSSGYDPIFQLDSVENKSSDARRLDIYRFVIFSLSRVSKSELLIQ